MKKNVENIQQNFYVETYKYYLRSSLEYYFRLWVFCAVMRPNQMSQSYDVFLWDCSLVKLNVNKLI